MIMRLMYRLAGILVILFMPVVSPYSSAQVISEDPEAAYDSVRVLAFEGHLQEAETMARDLVREKPGYGDAVVLLARIIAWQERYQESLELLDSLLEEQPGHDDALKARETISGWLQSARQADDHHAGIPALRQTGVDSMTVESADTSARGVDIFLGYSFDVFNKPYSRFWQIFRTGVFYNTGAGPVLGTVNFGNLHAGTDPRTMETGIQLQGEFWPRISEKSYAWLAYAYSPFDYFPRHRASAEYWYSTGKGWVLSAGASYFYFDRNIVIPSFSVEKYISRYWFSAKTYLHLKDAGTSASLFLTARRYSNDTDYFQLGAGAGTAPDEPWDLAADLERQQAFSFKLAYNKKLSDNITLKLSAGYSREEYNNDLWRNRYETFVNLIYKPSR